MFKFKLILDNLKGTSKQLSCPRIYIKKEPTEAKLKFQGSLLRPFLLDLDIVRKNEKLKKF